ncbi:MAG: putative RNA uridine N3 methyltransferase [Halobacteriota archaeon]
MLSIAIPSSSLINENDPKIKTYKVGSIARAAAVFRVDEVLIYHDPRKDESDFIADIMEYLRTPQYLRKRIFPLRSELKYVGVLPPLQIPSHRPKHLKVGEVREGVVRKVGPDGKSWVDVGADALALLEKEVRKGARLTVRVCSKKPLVVEEEVPQGYWGYKVSKIELKRLLSREGAVITSKRCNKPVINEIKDMLGKDLTLVFGNPEEGVFDISERLNIKIKNECWNMVPQQGTETVRLEEAIFSGLSVINFVHDGI